jgi:hypothetical protein
VLPVSRASLSAISVRRRLTISAALSSSRARSAGGVAAHAGYASAAAAMAASMSFGPPAGTRAKRSPL